MESGERLGYIEKIYYQDGNLQATAHWLVDEAKRKSNRANGPTFPAAGTMLP